MMKKINSVTSLLFMAVKIALAQYVSSPFLPNETWNTAAGSWHGEGYHTDNSYWCVDFNWGVGLEDKFKPIVASRSGIVEEAKYIDGLGNYVRILHDNGFKTLYAHFAVAPFVKKGETVFQGQVIGLTGMTGGTSTSTHLHWGYYNSQNVSVDHGTVDGQVLTKGGNLLSKNDHIFAEIFNVSGGILAFGESINYDKYGWWKPWTSGEYDNVYMTHPPKDGSEFKGGSLIHPHIIYDPMRGGRSAVLVFGRIWDKWKAMQGPESFLGAPIGPEYVPYFGGPNRQDFQGGYIDWNGYLAESKQYPEYYGPGVFEYITQVSEYPELLIEELHAIQSPIRGWSPIVSYLFAEAYKRNSQSKGMGYAYAGANHGSPAYVHPWLVNGNINDYLLVQNFTGGEYGDCIIMYDPDNPSNQTGEPGAHKAYVIRGGFWEYYRNHNLIVNFGSPLNDEYAYSGGSRQDFEKGWLEWNGNQVIAHDYNSELLTHHATITSSTLLYSNSIISKYTSLESAKDLGAKIWSNGSYVGQTPLSFNTNETFSYQLYALSPGYAKEEFSFNVGTTDLNINVELTPINSPVVDLVPQTLSFVQPDNYKSITITTNCVWTITTPSNCDWINLSKKSGAGDDEITMQVIWTRLTPGQHLATLTFTYALGLTKTIDIIASVPVLSFFPPQSIWISSLSDVEVGLEWANPGNPSGTTYKVYRDGNLLSQIDGLKLYDKAVTTGTTYQYEISAVYQNVESSKSNLFIVNVPVYYIMVNTPQGGEVYRTGNTETISYSYNLPSGHNQIGVELSRRGYPSFNWTQLAGAETADGDVDWLVREPASDSCIIKVFDENNLEIFGISKIFRVELLNPPPSFPLTLEAEAMDGPGPLAEGGRKILSSPDPTEYNIREVIKFPQIGKLEIEVIARVECEEISNEWPRIKALAQSGYARSGMRIINSPGWRSYFFTANIALATEDYFSLIFDEHSLYAPGYSVIIDKSILRYISSEPILSTDLTEFDFGSIVTQKSFNITNSGDGTLDWTIDCDKEWISCDFEGGLGEKLITLHVDRTFMPLGDNSGLVTISSNGGTAAINIQASNEPTAVQSITLPSGWSMISSYIAPQNPALQSLLTSISSSLTIIKNVQGQVYWPAYGINQILNWDFLTGYQIYLQSAATLNILGMPVIPESTPIPLLQGWDMIAYLRDAPMNIVTALAGIVSNLTIAKNVSGHVFWPAYGINTIGNMQPGQGYQIYVTAPSTLTYPANDVIPKAATLATKQPPMPTHYTPFRTNTGNSAMLLIFTAGLPDGAEIGAWTAKQWLVGSGVVSQSMALLTLWGDDTMTKEIDGALESETLALTCWLSEQNREFQIYCTSLKDGITQNVMSSILEYKSNAIWLAETDATTNILAESNIPSEFGLTQNYPNPFNPSTTIKYQLPREARVELVLYNISGVKVRTLVGGVKPAGYHEVLWDGRDDGNKMVTSGIYWVKMIADDYEKTFKMSLIK